MRRFSFSPKLGAPPLLPSSLSHRRHLLDEISNLNSAPTCPDKVAAALFNPIQAIRDRLRSEASLDPGAVAASLKHCRGREGLQLHGLVLSSGLDAYTIVSNSIMNLYSKSGAPDLALKVFDGMPRPDVVSWNTCLSGIASSTEALDFFALMRRTGVHPDGVTFTVALAASANLLDPEPARKLHSLVLKSGFGSDIILTNAVITSYARAGQSVEAHMVFNETPFRDSVTWNSLLCGLTQDSRGGAEAIELFLEMVRDEGVRPDRISVATVISACGQEGQIGFGCQVHVFATKVGVEAHVSVSNLLMSMYYKHRDVSSAKKVFDNMMQRDAISWTTMISIEPDNAIHLFNVMRLQDVQPNDVTFVALIFAVNDQLLREGQMVHGVGFKLGIAEELNVSISLITMYAKLKLMVDARKVFDAIHCKEIVSWNALVSGYAQNGQLEDALAVFSSLILHCMPNQYTFGSILSAITTTDIVSLAYGQSFHAHILKLGLNANAYVSVALIDLYAKRGSIDESRRAFEEAPLKSLITWTSIISAHSKHGNYEEVMSLFESLKRTGIHPDHITFLAVLVACCCKGKVDMGRKVFESMVDEFEIEPWQEHYACMVDMLGKAGRLEEAEEFLQLAPMPLGISALQSLLGACRVHRNAEMGSRMAEALMKVEPTESGAYVLMSNIYAEKGEWDNVAKLRRGMRQRGVRKEIGFSWVDVGSGESLHMHRFSSGDNTHPLAEEIHSMAESLGMEISYKKEDSDMGFYLAATN
ncbi:pentatricopeptide repeat-containing protein At4g32430, mitochondrial-like [Zingiber officinale]|uniref:pentatricopeptide repeat-containing protein At4g32430, mitochondrial-like n=1 Tax=Zingiber officinale TaxID=94328 RepID=UPI001C4C6CD2|nr:pentatricopeptide repeat-containing protein At4g32430, mitochondrial-like [Zingiber officinale]